MPLNDPKPIKTLLNGINCIAFIYLIFGFSIIYPDYIEQINITISIIFLMMILLKLTIQNISQKFLNIIQKIPKEIPKFIWGVQNINFYIVICIIFRFQQIQLLSQN